LGQRGEKGWASGRRRERGWWASLGNKRKRKFPFYSFWNFKDGILWRI
jgi:hypothetical protein